MHKIELTLPNRKGQGHTHHLSGPSGWHEVSFRQYLALCKVLMLVGKRPELRLTLPILLYNLSPKHAAMLFDAQALKQAGYPDVLRDQLLSYGQALLQTTDWVFDTLPTNWPFGLTPQGFHGPGDQLRELTFGEFIACERLADKVRAGDDSALPQLVAHLCVPASENRTERTPANEWVIEQARKRWAKAGRVDLFAWWLAYEAARTELVACFCDLFPKAEPQEAETTSADKATGHAASWATLALDMAEGSVEKFQINERANVYLVLSLLNRQLQKADEQ